MLYITKKSLDSRIQGTMRKLALGLSGDPLVKNLPASAGDTGLIPGLGRFHVPRSK